MQNEQLKRLMEEELSLLCPAHIPTPNQQALVAVQVDVNQIKALLALPKDCLRDQDVALMKNLANHIEDSKAWAEAELELDPAIRAWIINTVDKELPAIKTRMKEFE
ncbi:unnamed protein product [Vitrella brassicaformis CCMP3155]|uniref:Uncharacterized protein n=2 Tax=Vitrella brassicaformis TaxID=1169539 RepID=A0A0G4FMR5_VITBC|nr:unnamed protein product [Vitrella brassicaformis CCMP3155]|mmetsp:Transcript_13416/g.32028  ORF Transcript_13416/g.32028 Transcript_13416/m.32028 type:complete len:107 (+) Transcript_13416:61-381(+)|eukprot:CEM14873.1 unnamed protein product [Vitrella brassicaformis CCMP3155]